MANPDLKNIITAVFTSQASEKKVSEYKTVYKKYLIGIKNRTSILHSLNELQNRFEAIPVNNPLHIDKQLIKIDCEIKEFIKNNFPNEILSLYSAEIKAPPSKRRFPSSEDSFWGTLLVGLVTSLETVTEKHKTEWNYKKNFLKFLYSCLKDFGLHPNIQIRNPLKHKRYNAIIQHDFKSRKLLTEYKSLLSRDKFEKEFLATYEKKLPIKINGKLIPFKNIGVVKYTTTLLKDDELQLFALKHNFMWEENGKDELRFIEHCKDETEEFHSNPYSNNLIFYRNQSPFFIDPSRIEQLKKIKSSHFDLTRLIGMCEQLNVSMNNKTYISVTLLIRAIIDHVPPMFGFQNFSQFANNYGGAKSFKKSMINLDTSLRNIADAHIHIQVRDKEVLPTAIQADFTPELDLLLSEVIRKLK